MNLKTSLDALTMETAVLGSTVLGCGGGGKLEDGLFLGELAAAQGGAHLLDISDFSDLPIAAAVMPFYTSGHHTHQIDPTQAHLAVKTLQDEIGTAVSALINGGLGAVESMIVWELSGFLGVPLLDVGLTAAHHPASLPNLLAFLQETPALSGAEVAVTQTFTVSLTNRQQQTQLWRGQPTQLLQQLASLPDTEMESYVAAVGPLPLATINSENNRSSMSHALQVGQSMLAANDNGGEDTVAAIQSILPTQFSTFATVTEIDWHGHGQEAYGHINMRDVANRHLQLTYGQRYRNLTVDGQPIAVFPDLIITLGTLGTPLTGEEVFVGQDLYLMVVR